MSAPTIRAEAPGDEAAIHDLVRRAFAPMWFSDGSEPDLVDQLRRTGDLVLSLVAVSAQDEIVGHIGFSPVTIDQRDCGWFQMAPVSVVPNLQLQGIGTALIRAGLATMQRRGARGVAVVGNPVYYERFGFGIIPGLSPLAEHDAPYFRAQGFVEPLPVGTLRYAPAFG